MSFVMFGALSNIMASASAKAIYKLSAFITFICPAFLFDLSANFLNDQVNNVDQVKLQNNVHDAVQSQARAETPQQAIGPIATETVAGTQPSDKQVSDQNQQDVNNKELTQQEKEEIEKQKKLELVRRKDEELAEQRRREELLNKEIADIRSLMDDFLKDDIIINATSKVTDPFSKQDVLEQRRKKLKPFKAPKSQIDRKVIRSINTILNSIDDCETDGTGIVKKLMYHMRVALIKDTYLAYAANEYETVIQQLPSYSSTMIPLIGNPLGTHSAQNKINLFLAITRQISDMRIGPAIHAKVGDIFKSMQENIEDNEKKPQKDAHPVVCDAKKIFFSHLRDVEDIDVDKAWMKLKAFYLFLMLDDMYCAVIGDEDSKEDKAADNDKDANIEPVKRKKLRTRAKGKAIKNEKQAETKQPDAARAKDGEKHTNKNFARNIIKIFFEFPTAFITNKTWYAAPNKALLNEKQKYMYDVLHCIIENCVAFSTKSRKEGMLTDLLAMLPIYDFRKFVHNDCNKDILSEYIRSDNEIEKLRDFFDKNIRVIYDEYSSDAGRVVPTYEAFYRRLCDILFNYGDLPRSRMQDGAMGGADINTCFLIQENDGKFMEDEKNFFADRYSVMCEDEYGKSGVYLDEVEKHKKKRMELFYFNRILSQRYTNVLTACSLSQIIADFVIHNKRSDARWLHCIEKYGAKLIYGILKNYNSKPDISLMYYNDIDWSKDLPQRVENFLDIKDLYRICLENVIDPDTHKEPGSKTAQQGVQTQSKILYLNDIYKLAYGEDFALKCSLFSNNVTEILLMCKNYFKIYDATYVPIRARGRLGVKVDSADNNGASYDNNNAQVQRDNVDASSDDVIKANINNVKVWMINYIIEKAMCTEEDSDNKKKHIDNHRLYNMLVSLMGFVRNERNKGDTDVFTDITTILNVNGLLQNNNIGVLLLYYIFYYIFDGKGKSNESSIFLYTRLEPYIDGVIRHYGDNANLSSNILKDAETPIQDQNGAKPLNIVQKDIENDKKFIKFIQLSHLSVYKDVLSH